MVVLRVVMRSDVGPQVIARLAITDHIVVAGKTAPPEQRSEWGLYRSEVTE